MKESKIFNILSPILIIGTTIIVILFSRGWRLNLKEKTVVATGIIDITSDPKGATIYIDGEKKGKTPTVIDSIIPGVYQLELRKDLYTNWIKEVEIREEYVTKITANLFEENNELTQLTNTPLEDVIFSKSGNEAIVINTHNGDQGIWKTQLNQSFFQLEMSKIKIADLVEPDAFDILTSSYTILPNNNFSKAILYIEEKDNLKRYFMLDLLKANAEIIEISEYLEKAKDYKWLRDDLTLAIETEQELATFNTKDNILSIVSNWPVVTWTESNDNIYFINTNTSNQVKSIFTSRINGGSREKFLLNNEAEISEIRNLSYNQEYSTLIISSANDTKLLNTKTGKETLVFDSPSSIINISPNERYVIINNVSESKNYVYDFEENTLTAFMTSIEANPGDFTWTPNELKLFYRYTTPEAENKLISMDYDGTNFHELLNTTNYKGKLANIFGFSSDSKEVYFPLPLSLETDIDKSDKTTVWEEYIFKLQLR